MFFACYVCCNEIKGGGVETDTENHSCLCQTFVLTVLYALVIHCNQTWCAGEILLVGVMCRKCALLPSLSQGGFQSSVNICLFCFLGVGWEGREGQEEGEVREVVLFN